MRTDTNQESIMEQLIHYVWKHKLFPLTGLKTTDGQEVEVIDSGLHNHNAGPDFFNAKVKIGGTLWVGNVEIHDRASDWFLHRHDRNPNYNNVILHVAETIDVDVKTRQGDYPPQMRLQVPTDVREHYEELLTTDEYPACYRIIPNLSKLMVHSWMSALQTERLEQKTEAIAQRVKDCEQRAGLSQLLECESVKQVRELLATQVTRYWETHYVFGEESAKSEKKLSAASLNLQIINTVAPILFAYGKHKNSEKYCERAFDFLEALKAEDNHIVRMWKEVGLMVETAGDSQALIQLKKAYCDRKDCLRCRIGYEYLKGSSSLKG